MNAIRPVPLILCFFLLQALGFAWYHEALFGAAWLADAGLDPATMGAPHPMVWVVMAASTLIKLVLLAVLLDALGAKVWGPGLVWGVVLGFGLLALTLASHHGFAMRPPRQSIIEGAQEIVGYALAGALLAGWPRR